MITKKYFLLNAERVKLCKQISRARGCNPGYKTKYPNPHAGAAWGGEGAGRDTRAGERGAGEHGHYFPGSGRQTSGSHWPFCLALCLKARIMTPRSLLAITDGPNNTSLREKGPRRQFRRLRTRMTTSTYCNCFPTALHLSAENIGER